MNEKQMMVRAFNRKFGRPAPDEPTEMDMHTRLLGARLILEEALECCEALGVHAVVPAGTPLPAHVRDVKLVLVGEQDTVGLVDAICDLFYVVAWAEVGLGIDCDGAFREVHRANMTKDGGGKDHDVKLLKPEGWKPPDIAGVLREQYPESNLVASAGDEHGEKQVG